MGCRLTWLVSSASLRPRHAFPLGISVVSYPYTCGFLPNTYSCIHTHSCAFTSVSFYMHSNTHPSLHSKHSYAFVLALHSRVPPSWDAANPTCIQMHSYAFRCIHISSDAFEYGPPALRRHENVCVCALSRESDRCMHSGTLHSFCIQVHFGAFWCIHCLLHSHLVAFAVHSFARGYNATECSKARMQ